VFFFTEKEKESGFRQVVFRIMVTRFDSQVECDYGFTEVAGNENIKISSPEKGGSILPFEKSAGCLYYRTNVGFERLAMTGKEIDSIKKQAEKVYRIFNRGFAKNRKLRIMGIDLVPEVRATGIYPVFLEINPRPSGLNKLSKIQ